MVGEGGSVLLGCSGGEGPRGCRGGVSLLEGVSVVAIAVAAT